MRSPSDPICRSSLREAMVVLAAFAAVSVYTLAYAWLMGYGHAADEVSVTWGVPDWVLWGIFVPWVGCVAFTGWFCFAFVTDGDLEAESAPPESEREEP